MTLATGGTITETEGYRRHTFTSSADLVVSVAGSIDYLLIAGGGGGGGAGSGSACGGGGAGGLLTGSASLTVQTYPVVIGTGGNGGATGLNLGINGVNSTFNSLTAVGGGGGGYANASTGNSGGSGGGAGASQVAATTSGAAGTGGQGNAGGSGNSSLTLTEINAGGGGGASAVGGNGTTTTSGVGGVGTQSSYSGTATYYAGGGGGGKRSGTANIGGAGGGGAGGSAGAGTAATANTGGGGGGGAASGVGGNGAAGVAIIRYIGTVSVTDAGTENYVTGSIVPITGTNFISTRGTGRVVISPTDNVADGGAVEQTIVSWGDTAITIEAVRGTLANSTTLYLFVENDLNVANSAGVPVTFAIPTAIVATGGTVADGTDGYRRHTFNSSADLIVSVGGAVSYLLVGGGGGSGRGAATTGASAGGGGGAVKTGTPTLAAGTFPVVIGGGGAGRQVDSSGVGAPGTASTFNGVTAGGGGEGAFGTSAGGSATNGGSGGGGGGGATAGTNPAGGTSTGGGFAGGTGFGGTTATRSAGGGGGAGEIGEAGATTNGGDGGDGVQSSLSGAATYYGGGGGGSAVEPGTVGAGGLGGGAAAIKVAGYPNATANTGGGGGGNIGIASGGGGNGGSGLAIVRYLGTLTVTDAGDEVYVNGDAVTITGTYFIATQGTGRVVISPTDNIADAGAVTQTVTLWGNTSVNITIVRGSLPYVSTCYLFVENDLDASNAAGHAVAFQAPAPTITDADDEAYNSGGEAFTITGTNFLPTQGAGSVLISPTDNVNDAGAITQGVTSWSDTSIGATTNQASLASGVTLYLFVKNAGLVSNAAGWPVVFNFAPVTITDAGDELYDNAEAVTITGTGFISLQGAGFVTISPTDDIDDAGAVTQTVTSWSSTSIDITAVQGSLPLGVPLYLFVENNVGTSNVAGFSVEFEEAPIPEAGGGFGFIEGIGFIEYIE